MSAGVVSGLDRSFRRQGHGPGHQRPHPGGRRGQPGQLRRAAARPQRAGSSASSTALLNPTQQDVFIGIGLAVPIDVAGGAAGLPNVLAAPRRRTPRGPRPRGQPERAVPMERLLYEVKKVIVGQDHLLERMVVALLARGHLLVEGVPGLAKTMAIKTLAQAIGGDFKRIQFTPDLVPVGPRRDPDLQPEDRRVRDLARPGVHEPPAGRRDQPGAGQGPVSALLEVMQERQVTIGHETHPVPEPFLVLATQNPIETEGTYSLPEAQVDRFMLKVVVGYPTPTEEFAIVERMTTLGRARRAGPHDRRARDAPAGGRHGVRRPGAVRLRGPARGLDPARRAGFGMPELARLHHLRRQPARVDQPDPDRQGPRLRARPRRTSCPRTCSTWPPTSSATGSCCRTRR